MWRKSRQTTLRVVTGASNVVRRSWPTCLPKAEPPGRVDVGRIVCQPAHPMPPAGDNAVSGLYDDR